MIKMESLSTHSGNFIRLLVFAVAIVIVFAIFSRMFVNPPAPVQVNECSLTSSTVKSGEQVPIVITVQSNDAHNQHSIRMEFSSHYLVRFLIGSRELQKAGTIWYHEETLESKSTLTNVINVLPTLESGISSITYRISVVIYMDGEEFFNKNLDIVVHL
jgi:hypothetical protein